MVNRALDKTGVACFVAIVEFCALCFSGGATKHNSGARRAARNFLLFEI
jgi:hypothetical protein